MGEHVIKECDCNNEDCPICNWGAEICKNCGGAEGELDQPCEPPKDKTDE